MKDDEVELIKRCMRNDSVAQEAIFNLYYNKMYHEVVRNVNGLDESEKCDIMVDAFTKVLTKIDQYKFDGSFEGWIRRIVKNTLLDKLKNTQRQRETMQSLNYTDDDGKEKSIDVADESSDFSQELECDAYQRLIDALPPQYRRVFVLYAIEGYPHNEIAKLLGISEGASKSNLSRARAILQDEVEKLYGKFNLTSKCHE